MSIRLAIKTSIGIAYNPAMYVKPSPFSEKTAAEKTASRRVITSVKVPGTDGTYEFSDAAASVVAPIPMSSDLTEAEKSILADKKIGNIELVQRVKHLRTLKTSIKDMANAVGKGEDYIKLIIKTLRIASPDL